MSVNYVLEMAGYWGYLLGMLYKGSNTTHDDSFSRYKPFVTGPNPRKGISGGEVIPDDDPRNVRFGLELTQQSGYHLFY